MFETKVTQDVKNLIPRRWNWKEMAQKTQLDVEYSYIYSFISTLLHATPASITTDQKSLELTEIWLFLRYINVKISDVLSLSKNCAAVA